MTKFVGPCRWKLLVGRWRVPPREDWVVKALDGRIEKDEGRMGQQLIRLPGEYKLAWLSPMARIKKAARLTSQALEIERRRTPFRDEKSPPISNCLKPSTLISRIYKRASPDKTKRGALHQTIVALVWKLRPLDRLLSIVGADSDNL